MSQSPGPVLRVRDWDRLYENNRSRDLKRTDWFPAPNDLSADGYVDLVTHPDGAAHLGVWHAVLMVASRAKHRRGVLVKEDGRPHTTHSLAGVTRLPEAVVGIAISRLLEIGLLLITDSEAPKTNNLSPHPGAGNPHAPASKPQDTAAEGKGTEHHHQEEKRTGNEGQRTEPDGTERAVDDFETDRSGAGCSPDFSQIRFDDGEKPIEVYASPEDELKAIFLVKAGEPITVAVLDAIRLNLELTGVEVGDFVSEVTKHPGNDWQNPAGFLRDLSKRFRAKTRPASAPVTAAEAEKRNYRCARCDSSVPGEGVILDGNRMVPCSCASQEYIRRLRDRGIFAPEANP
jgi:hypothetical protein